MNEAEIDTEWEGLKFLGSAGVRSIFSFFLKGNYFQSSRKVAFKSFSEIIKGTGLHNATLSNRLKDLLKYGLVLERESLYTISPRGVLVYKWATYLEDFKTTSEVDCVVNKFQEKQNLPGMWTMQIFPLIGKTKDEMLMISRYAGSIEDPEWKQVYQQSARVLASKLAKKGNKIRMILDPKIKDPKCKELYSFWSEIGEIRFFPNEILQGKPAGILNPIVVGDLGHLMICDRKHWIYLEPHKHGNKFTEKSHVGIVTENDPLTASYLADIFESLWWLIEGFKK